VQPPAGTDGPELVFQVEPMLNSRRILIALFALGLMFPPSWVLCVEASGEVRVESTTVACCEGEDTPDTTPATAVRDTEDCNDCRDVALSMSLHRSKSSHEACATPSRVDLPLTVLLPAPRRAPAQVSRPSHEILTRLASVVILR
jgi:hypothetical protein